MRGVAAEFVSFADAARITGVPKVTLLRWVAAGLVVCVEPEYSAGRRMLVLSSLWAQIRRARPDWKVPGG